MGKTNLDESTFFKLSKAVEDGDPNGMFTTEEGVPLKAKLTGSFNEIPSREDILEPFNEQLIVELYSK